MSEATPHDDLVRAVFGKMEMARPQLTALLPDEVVRALDLTRLELQQGTFIDEELKRNQSDLLFKAPLAGREDEALIYVLMEHQSSVDRDMPWRIYRYMERVWARWKGNSPRAHGRLPPIVPVVLYHGARRWTGPASLRAMFGLEAPIEGALARHLPAFEVIVEDLTQRSEDEVVQMVEGAPAMVPLTLLNLKTIAYLRDTMAVMEALMRWGGLIAEMLRQPGGDEHTIKLLYYMTSVRADLDPELVIGGMKQAAQQSAEEDLMPHPNKYVRALEEKGRAEGMAEGRAEGEARTRANMIVVLLKVRFDEASAEAARPRAAMVKPEDIERISKAILTASSVDEVFAVVGL